MILALLRLQSTFFSKRPSCEAMKKEDVFKSICGVICGGSLCTLKHNFCFCQNYCPRNVIIILIYPPVFAVRHPKKKQAFDLSNSGVLGEVEIWEPESKMRFVRGSETSHLKTMEEDKHLKFCTEVYIQYQ